MSAALILLGDVNLMNVDDPCVPFARVGARLRAADLVFADPEIAGAALCDGAIAAVGLANNVNYGTAAILGSIARLDRLGIAHTGAGADLAAARAPAVVERAGLRFGFVQRSAVYWPTNHEASL